MTQVLIKGYRAAIASEYLKRLVKDSNVDIHTYSYSMEIYEILKDVEGVIFVYITKDITTFWDWVKLMVRNWLGLENFYTPSRNLRTYTVSSQHTLQSVLKTFASAQGWL